MSTVLFSNLDSINRLIQTMLSAFWKNYATIHHWNHSDQHFYDWCNYQCIEKQQKMIIYWQTCAVVLVYCCNQENMATGCSSTHIEVLWRWLQKKNCKTNSKLLATNAAMTLLFIYMTAWNLSDLGSLTKVIILGAELQTAVHVFRVIKWTLWHRWLFALTENDDSELKPIIRCSICRGDQYVYFF